MKSCGSYIPNWDQLGPRDPATPRVGGGVGVGGAEDIL